MTHRPMETMTQAVARLERRGFTVGLRATLDGCLRVGDEDARPADEFVVEEVVRFEGVSDPGDEAVLFALRTREDDVRGTFVATYGPRTDPACAAVIERLPNPPPESR
jgi:hypothetical protein